MVRISQSLPQIFVSYSRRDTSFVYPLIEYLQRELGDEQVVWFDQQIPLGENWWGRIKKQLKRSTIFLVILSVNSLNSKKSKYVKQEIDIAWHRYVSGKIEIIPVQYQACRIPEDLSTLNVISFPQGGDDPASLARLLEHLRASTQARALTALLDEAELERLQQMIERIHHAFDRQDWDAIVRMATALIRQYPRAIPHLIYKVLGLAYLFSPERYRNHLSLAEHAVEKALVKADDPLGKLEALDIYAGILMSQERWHELSPHITYAFQLLPPAEHRIKFTATDEGVWSALQEEMQRRVAQKVQSSTEVTPKARDQIVEARRSKEEESHTPLLEDEAAEIHLPARETRIFKMDISWSWQHFQILIKSTPATSEKGDIPADKVS